MSLTKNIKKTLGASRTFRFVVFVTITFIFHLNLHGFLRSASFWTRRTSRGLRCLPFFPPRYMPWYIYREEGGFGIIVSTARRISSDFANSCFQRRHSPKKCLRTVVTVFFTRNRTPVLPPIVFSTRPCSRAVTVCDRHHATAACAVTPQDLRCMSKVVCMI